MRVISEKEKKKPGRVPRTKRRSYPSRNQRTLRLVLYQAPLTVLILLCPVVEEEEEEAEGLLPNVNDKRKASFLEAFLSRLTLLPIRNEAAITSQSRGAERWKMHYDNER